MPTKKELKREIGVLRRKLRIAQRSKVEYQLAFARTIDNVEEWKEVEARVKELVYFKPSLQVEQDHYCQVKRFCALVQIAMPDAMPPELVAKAFSRDLLTAIERGILEHYQSQSILNRESK